MTEPLNTALLGSWKLESWTIRMGVDEPDAESTQQPFGQHPAGLLIYSPDGWMSATVHRSARASFPATASPRRLPAEQLADAFTSYFHYAGTWRIEGQSVIHSVRHALNPNMVGTEQVRGVNLNGNTLVLTGLEPITTTKRHHVLVWARLP